MRKLRIINQPLTISGIDLDELNDSIQGEWDDRAETLEQKHNSARRKLFKMEEA